MKHNKMRILFCSILSSMFFMTGCANKTSQEHQPENNNDVVVSSYGSSNENYSFQEATQRDTIHFNFDSSAILPEDHALLDSLATSFKDTDDDIVIYGHTDQIGTRSYNLALGERRANAVKDYLVKEGIDASRIGVVSYGFEKPVVPGFTKEACAANRRAQVVKK